MNTNTKRIKKCALKALRRRLEVLATPITFAVTSFVSLCCFCQSATASDAPLAYDGFNYTLNQTLLGQGTDAGWASSGQTYTISAGDGTGAHSEVSDMTPYLNLETSGNQLNLLGASAPGGASGVYRNLGTTYNTANNDYWFSALLQLDTTAGNSYAGISLFSNTSEALFFGQTWQGTTWSVQSYHGGGVVSSGISTLNSSNGFLVVELNGVSHTANFYVNPTSLGGSAPDTTNNTFSFSDFSFDRLRIQAGSETLDVDELRFGTTYASVTPTAVPEPATLSLLALGGVALLRRRRVRGDD